MPLEERIPGKDLNIYELELQPQLLERRVDLLKVISLEVRKNLGYLDSEGKVFEDADINGKIELLPRVLQSLVPTVGHMFFETGCVIELDHEGKVDEMPLVIDTEKSKLNYPVVISCNIPSWESWLAEFLNKDVGYNIGGESYVCCLIHNCSISRLNMFARLTVCFFLFTAAQGFFALQLKIWLLQLSWTSCTLQFYILSENTTS